MSRRRDYRLLLTGFDPFKGLPDNPSHRCAHRLATAGVPGVTITPLTVPTEWRRSGATLTRALRSATLAYDGVLMLGLAQGSDTLRLETTAVNRAAASIPDNVGEVRDGRAIQRGGPHALGTTVRVDPLLAALTERGLPFRLSHTAGTYVCNTLYYRALAHDAAPRDVLFVHIPATAECLPQEGIWTYPIIPSGYLDTCVRAVIEWLAAQPRRRSRRR